MTRMRVVMNIPSPYRLHIFSEMYRQLDKREVDFKVYFMCKGHPDRPLWYDPEMDFPHQYFMDYGYKCHHFNPGIIAQLRKDEPDIILSGSPFDTFTTISLAWLCPAKVRSAWCEGQTKTPGVMNGFRGWFKRLVLSKYDVVAVPGSDARKYIGLHQALSSRQMPTPLYLPNLVDESRFRPRELWPEEEIQHIRSQLGVSSSDKLCFISARLEPVKGLLEFIDLLNAEMLEGWKVAIFGEGYLEQDIRTLIQEKKLSDKISVSPYIRYNDMPAYYAASDLFLLPSIHDPNPLSAIEALHSGLPIALSDRAGNVEEAVTDEVNGWRLPVNDREKYAQVLQSVFSTPLDKLKAMGSVSKQINSEFWNTKKCISRYLKELFSRIERI